MQIHVNVNHLGDSARIQDWVGDTVAAALGRYEGMFTRAEVHLSEAKADPQCRIELFSQGQPSISVACQAQTATLAVEGAVQKMSGAIEHDSGRLEPPINPAGHPEGSPVLEHSSEALDALREDEFLAREARREKK